MKVLVCGGRDFKDEAWVFRVLDDLNPDEVVQGCARGADSMAGLWARAHGKIEHRHPADWAFYGAHAGTIRNEMMLRAHPDIERVIAFPGGAGTEDMIARARAKGVYVQRMTNWSDVDGL
jgi:hypothetical protein